MSAQLVMVCVGTRPEAIKMAPVLHALADAGLQSLLVSTGQHREMLQQAFDAFDLEPDIDLELMRPDQTLAELTGRAVAALDDLIGEIRPRAVLVQGDTTTAFCGALAAFYQRVPVGHVEAGLRTGHRRNPFPEEINRRLITPLADWHFCPTERSVAGLLAEGVPADCVLLTGNTVVDALLATAGAALEPSLRELLPPRGARRRLLVTLHRRETQGEAQRALCRMLAAISSRDDVEVVFPVHLSPAVRASVHAELGARPNVHLLEPLAYRPFVHLLRSADIVITDSGGIQEEAPSFGVPVLVMRETTERPEGVKAGCAKLSGTDPAGVAADIELLLDDPGAYERMARVSNPYGDGRAGARIAERLVADLASGGPAARALSPHDRPCSVCQL
jgi:UDP-N-acetylglucosamine 2-epimerase (non-hydrolysing)